MPYRHFGAFRLFLAGLVVFQHFTANAAPDWLHDACAAYAPGSSAVLVFFVLSGFVIAESAERFYQGKPFAFMANRLLRIVPHFVLSILLSVALHGAFFHAGILDPGRDFTPGPDFAAAFSPVSVLLNTLGFLPIPLRRWAPYDFLNVAWAIRIEMAFYLAVFISLLLVAWGRMPARTRLSALAIAAALVQALSVAGLLAPKAGLVAYFALGYSLYQRLAGNRAAGWFALACLPAIALNFMTHATNTVPAGVQEHDAADALLLAALLAGLAWLAAQNFIGGRQLDRTLGDLSYPWYMYHINVLTAAVSLAGPLGTGGYLLAMVTSLGVAAVLSRLVDPLVAGLRDRVRGGQVASATG